jgi:hypothetical protein
VLGLSFALSLAGALLVLVRSDAPARLVALVLLVLGWCVRLHAGPGFDGVPAQPLLAHPLDLSPVLGCALGGAGVFLAGTGCETRRWQLLAGLGALLLLAAGLYPETELGGVTLPLLAALKTPGLPLLLDLLLLLAGGLLVAAIVRNGPAPRWTWSLLYLAILPLWLCLGLAFRPALLAAGDLLTLTGGLVLFASTAWQDRSLVVTAEVTAVVLSSVLWWLLKLHGFGYAGMDEYIYFYAANSWAQGIWPYRDFFFSHPPAHIAVPMVLFALFGFHHVLAKLVAPLTMFIAGLVLWRSARRHFGPFAGAVALILFWFASEVMVASTTFTGVELTTLFLTLGITRALDRKSFAAGLWFGVAACTGIYGVAGFFTFGVLALAAPPRPVADRGPASRFDALRMAAGFFLVFGVVNLAFVALGGSHYIDGVYRYHFLKAMKDPNEHSLADDPLALLWNFGVLLQGRDFRITLYLHAAQYWLAAMGLGLLFFRRGGEAWSLLSSPRSWWPAKPGESNRDGFVLMLLLSLLGTLMELGSLKERYYFYFTLTIPTLALLGGFGASEILRLCTGALAPQAPAPAPRGKGKGAVESVPPPVQQGSWITALVVGALATLWVPLDGWANVTAFPEEVTAQGSSHGAGEEVHFEWTPSPVLPELGEIVHALVWKDTRTRGEIVPTIRHFLWTKKRTFETAPEIAAYIDAHTDPDDTITGASDFAPLIALLSHRRLSGNQVDTNTKVFLTHIVSEDDYWSSTCKDHPAYIVATEASYFAPATFNNRPRIENSFKYEMTFDDHGLKLGRAFPIQLWRRIREPPESICGG